MASAASSPTHTGARTPTQRDRDVSAPMPETMEGMRDALRQERQRVFMLQDEMERLRRAAVNAAAAAEAEEEAITLKLMRRLEQLKAEKAALAMEVEREEEFLTNTLQRKLAAVQREKGELENRLEAEQEHIVNRLQKQMLSVAREKAALESKISEERARLDGVVREKTQLEKRVEEETQRLEEASRRAEEAEAAARQRIKEALEQSSREKVQLEATCEAEAEYIVNKLTKQLHAAQGERETYRVAINALAADLQGIQTAFALLVDRAHRAQSDESGRDQVDPGAWSDVLRRITACAQAAAKPLAAAPDARSTSGTPRPRTPRAERPVAPLEARPVSPPMSPPPGARWTTFVSGPRSPGARGSQVGQGDEAYVVLSAKDYSALKHELSQLRNENFVLTQRLEGERERVAALSTETSRLASDLEVDSERFFNVRTRARGASIDSTGSTPVPGLARTPVASVAARPRTPASSTRVGPLAASPAIGGKVSDDLVVPSGTRLLGSSRSMSGSHTSLSSMGDSMEVRPRGPSFVAPMDPALQRVLASEPTTDVTTSPRAGGRGSDSPRTPGEEAGLDATALSSAVRRASLHAGLMQGRYGMSRESSRSSLGASPRADAASLVLLRSGFLSPPEPGDDNKVPRPSSNSFGSTASFASGQASLHFPSSGVPASLRKYPDTNVPTSPPAAVPSARQHLHIFGDSRRGSVDSFSMAASEDGDSASAAALSIAMSDDHDSHAHFTRTLRCSDDDMIAEELESMPTDSDREGGAARGTRSTQLRSHRSVARITGLRPASAPRPSTIARIAPGSGIASAPPPQTVQPSDTAAGRHDGKR